MDFIVAGILCIALLLVLMAIGVPIGVSFILTGIVTSFLILGQNRMISLLGQATYSSIAKPTWTCIPLFILMGAFASSSGFASRAYRSINILFSRIPGSLGIATCFSCAAFGAISGSSIATSAIFGKLALPEMNRYGYPKLLSIGCIASAGTFASMIPPSMMFIVYALFTQQSVAKLFAAGILPGLFTASVYSAYIFFRMYNNIESKKIMKEHINDLTAKQKVEHIIGIWPILVIATIVMSGLYLGFFTPTEAAAIGSLITLLLGWLLKEIKSVKIVTTAMKESANTTAMIFIINIGALYFSRVLAMTGLPAEMANTLIASTLPAWVILATILLIMFLLGMIMVPIGIFAILLPIIFPIITKLGYDPIWFGVLCLKLTEIGAITPPVGLNAYALKSVVSSDIRLEDIFKGCMPFVLCEVGVLIILIIFPQISLWLPNLLFG